MKDKYEFLSKKIYDYMPDNLSEDQKKTQLKELLNEKNNYDTDEQTPFQIIFEN